MPPSSEPLSYYRYGLTQRRVPSTFESIHKDNDDDDDSQSTSSHDSERSLGKSNAMNNLNIFLSLCAIAFGWYRAFHGNPPVSLMLKCDPQECILKQYEDGSMFFLHLYRHQLVRTDLVRLAAGERKREKHVVQYLNGPHATIRDTAPSQAATSNHLSTSFSLVYHEEEDHHHDHHEIPIGQPNVFPITPHDRHDEEKLATFIMKPLDLSIKSDKVAYNHLKHYIGGRRSHVLVEHVEPPPVSFLGLAILLLGCIGFLMAVTVLTRRMKQRPDVIMVGTARIKEDD